MKEVFDSMNDEQLGAAQSALYDSTVREELEELCDDRFQGDPELYQERLEENELKSQ